MREVAVFWYQVRIAILSIKRHPILSAMITLGLAVGIGVFMTMSTYYRNKGWNPMAYKNDVLYNVRLNSWDPDNAYKGENDPPEQLTYLDAMAVMDCDIPTYKNTSYRSLVYVHPPNKNDKPSVEDLRFVFRDFFLMFDVPFVYGGPWSKEADARAEPVVVIDRETNERLFGGQDSVGQWLRLDSQEYRITGVLDSWHPAPKVFDLTNWHWSSPEPVYIPFHHMETLEKSSWGNTNCWQSDDGDTFRDFLNSECVFLQVWVELQTQEQHQQFQAFLDNYTEQQREYGRYQRPTNNLLLNVAETLRDQEVLGKQCQTDMIIACLALIVCVLNVIGLILGKFMARLGESGIRRALGASRRAIFQQHLVEASVLGVVGGALGYPLTLVGLHIMRVLTNDPSAIFRFEPIMLAGLLTVSILSAIVAGIYPAWHVTRMQPVTSLKTS